jgi:hypothetical protein
MLSPGGAGAGNCSSDPPGAQQEVVLRNLRKLLVYGVLLLSQIALGRPADQDRPAALVPGHREWS